MTSFSVLVVCVFVYFVLRLGYGGITSTTNCLHKLFSRMWRHVWVYRRVCV